MEIFMALYMSEFQQELLISEGTEVAKVPGGWATFGVVPFRLPSSLLYDENALTCSCGYDKMPLTGKLTNNRNVFAEVLDGRENEVMVQAGVASGENSQEASHGAFPCCVLYRFCPHNLTHFSKASAMQTSWG